MSSQNASFHIRNRNHGHRNRHSLSPRSSEFGSMRLSRAMMPPTNSGMTPSQLNFANIPGGGSSNLGGAIFEMNSPTRRTVNGNITKMIDSPPTTPLSITSIMSISPLGHNRAARKAMVKAKKQNDAMIYIEGPQVYTCSHCRTHLTSHDDIISKSFHGRHGRAYLFDQCVNVFTGPHENRRLMTGLHTVCDIHCKRCKRVVGWTYSKAYEQSQKYKEGKFVIEKINLHLEESEYYRISHPAGERDDHWRKRSMSWGSSHECPSNSREYNSDMVYEYDPMNKYSKADINNGTSSPTTASSSYFDSMIEAVPQPQFPDLGNDTTL